jgi:hypothetical protein
MDDNIVYIFEVFFEFVLDLMCDQMPCPNGLLSIHEDMELNDTIESALAHDTSIDVFDVFIFGYDSSDCLLHIWIIDLIEEFSDGRPTDMVDIVTHEHGSDEGRPVSRRGELRSCEKRNKRTDQCYPCRYGI